MRQSPPWVLVVQILLTGHLSVLQLGWRPGAGLALAARESWPAERASGEGQTGVVEGPSAAEQQPLTPEQLGLRRQLRRQLRTGPGDLPSQRLGRQGSGAAALPVLGESDQVHRPGERRRLGWLCALRVAGEAHESVPPAEVRQDRHRHLSRLLQHRCAAPTPARLEGRCGERPSDSHMKTRSRSSVSGMGEAPPGQLLGQSFVASVRGGGVDVACP
mmetsp:Transcript_34594/g.109515  ORF Transcript_34594/g.109515 Transcript_34594/m.109515 type:complete len:217 (+) Transcript_34594:191-841(+)